MSIERERGDIPAMKGLLVNFFRLQVILACAAWAIVFFGAQAVASFYGEGDIAILFQIVSFAFLISPMRTVIQVFQKVYLRFFQQSMYTFLEEAWKFALLLPFFFLFDLGVKGLLLSIVLSQFLAIVSILPAFFRIDRMFWKNEYIDYDIFHLLRFHGKWGIFSTYVGTLGRNIRPWLIKFFLGTEAVGLFAVVQGLIGHTVSLIPLDQVMAPILPRYADTKERFYRLINKAVKYQLLGYAIASAGAFVAAPFVIEWFFPQYLPALPLFQVMLLMLITTAFDVVFTLVFLAIKAQKDLFFASLYKLVLAIILMPLCLHFFGLFGIAYANILINTLYVFERYRKLRKLLPGFAISPKGFFVSDEDDALVFNIFKNTFLGVWQRRGTTLR